MIEFSPNASEHTNRTSSYNLIPNKKPSALRFAFSACLFYNKQDFYCWTISFGKRKEHIEHSEAKIATKEIHPFYRLEVVFFTDINNFYRYKQMFLNKCSLVIQIFLKCMTCSLYINFLFFKTFFLSFIHSFHKRTDKHPKFFYSNFLLFL